MKIGILTQPLESNYGGILQNYALQEVLRRLGHSPLTLEKNKKEIRWWKNIILYCLRELGVSRYKNYRTTNERVKSLSAIKTFIDGKISVIRSTFSLEELMKLVDEAQFDAFIVGSDQVWRPSYSPNLYNYFLDFIVNRKVLKIAYSASFGVDYWEFNEGQTIKCRKLIKKFDAISVREKSGIALCEKFLDIKPNMTLDPTLLLEGKDYIEKFSLTEKKTKYILAYILDPSKENLSILSRISEKQKIQIRMMNCSINVRGNTLPSIKDWLDNIFNAEYVITDSFHGTVFSILFNKNFATFGNIERGLSRFSSILNLCEIENRLFVGCWDDKIIMDILSLPINYEKINLIIEEERIKSISFLKDNLYET